MAGVWTASTGTRCACRRRGSPLREWTGGCPDSFIVEAGSIHAATVDQDHVFAAAPGSARLRRMAVRHSPARRGFPAAEETQRPSPREAAGLLGRIRAQEMAGAGEVAQDLVVRSQWTGSRRRRSSENHCNGRFPGTTAEWAAGHAVARAASVGEGGAGIRGDLRMHGFAWQGFGRLRPERGARAGDAARHCANGPAAARTHSLSKPGRSTLRRSIRIMYSLPRPVPRG